MSNETRADNLRFITGKNPDDVVAERHDMVLLFDATKANPNGDPDADNMPRTNPMTLRGFVTDGCLKRKVRNFFSLYHPNGVLKEEDGRAQAGYEIFVRESAVFETTMMSTEVAEQQQQAFQELIKNLQLKADGETQSTQNANASEQSTDAQASLLQSRMQAQAAAPPADSKRGKGGSKKDRKVAATSLYARDDNELKQRAFRDALCKVFFDVRTFGQVASTKGPLEGSFYGQIRGPVQFSFAESLDKVLQLDASITRCALTTEKQAKDAEKQSNAQNQTQGDDGESTEESTKGNRTMGRKRWVDYGLYRTHIYLSPAFAQKTKFTYRDLDNFLFALQNMFRDDSSAARPGGMRVVGLVDFKHSTALGNAPAHKLFEQVVVEWNPDSKLSEDGREKDFPTCLEDYHGSAPEGEVNLNGSAATINGDGSNRITANRIIWDIPSMPDAKDTKNADSKSQS